MVYVLLYDVDDEGGRKVGGLTAASVARMRAAGVGGPEGGAGQSNAPAITGVDSKDTSHTAKGAKDLKGGAPSRSAASRRNRGHFGRAPDCSGASGA